MFPLNKKNYHKFFYDGINNYEVIILDSMKNFRGQDQNISKTKRKSTTCAIGNNRLQKIFPKLIYNISWVLERIYFVTFLLLIFYRLQVSNTSQFQNLFILIQRK